MSVSLLPHPTAPLMSHGQRYASVSDSDPLDHTFIFSLVLFGFRQIVRISVTRNDGKATGELDIVVQHKSRKTKEAFPLSVDGQAAVTGGTFVALEEPVILLRVACI